MGREVNLELDLDRWANGDPCTLSDWENPDAKHEWGPGRNPSSKNIYKLSRALRILNYAKMKNKTKLAHAERECIQIFLDEKQNGYMSNEQDSPIYWYFHLTLPIAIVNSSENDELRTLAYEWLYNFHLTMDLCDIYPQLTNDSEILLCGMRGVDAEDWSVDQLEWLHCGGTMGNNHYFKWYRPFMKKTGNVWWANVLPNLPRHAVVWPKKVPLHIINYEHGKVVYVSHNINSNTPCRQAAIYDATGKKRDLWYSTEDPARKGVAGYCPANHARHRQELDTSYAIVASGYQTLAYSSEFFTGGKEVRYDLSSLGKVLQHRMWDQNGLTDNVDEQTDDPSDVVVPTRPTRPRRKGCKLFG